MIERVESDLSAVVLVAVDFGDGDFSSTLSEFVDLVKAAGAEPKDVVTGARKRVDATTFVGKGKVDEIHQLVIEHDVSLVIFNHDLSPSQERNLEKILCCRVLDRTGLILDIFSQRARSHEGKLQVELAQLEHLSTRLVRGWTHLERQKGGIGLRGPGETQLETDRRLLRARIQQLNASLAKVASRRDLNRRHRQKKDVPTVSLVGYTNAGKSTLFNALTRADAYVADQLFATLDPTFRRLDIDGFGPIVLADTVGFVSQLPHQLVAAFRSTLEEAAESSLLLHVVDSSNEHYRDQMADVNRVLQSIGADELPVIEVFNKIDCVESGQPRVDRDQHGHISRVWISAQSGAGLDWLSDALGEFFKRNWSVYRFHIPASNGKLRAQLFQYGHVVDESVCEDGAIELAVELDSAGFSMVCASEAFSHECLM